MRSSSWFLRSGLGLLGLVLVLGVASGARADDQQICSSVTLSGFNNSNVTTGFTTTDAFDGLHLCSAGTSSSCSACNTYSSPPKNAGFYLCLPSALDYSITSSCQSLLATGVSQGCTTNGVETSSPVACPFNSSVVEPSCNWRTNANTSNTVWSWQVTFDSSTGALVVSCSNTNFQGPEQ